MVRQTNGDGHAVLTVLTDRGDLVLDNLDPHIMLWSETSYQFVKRQSEFDSGQWVAIEDGRSHARSAACRTDGTTVSSLDLVASHPPSPRSGPIEPAPAPGPAH